MKYVYVTMKLEAEDDNIDLSYGGKEMERITKELNSKSSIKAHIFHMSDICIK